MEFTSYVRKPFIVEAIKVTAENIEQVAEHVGTICTNEDGSKFIEVDRKKVPNVFKVTPGYWLTRKQKGNYVNYRCFPKHIFETQFVTITGDIEDFLAKLDPTDDPANFPDEGKIQGADGDGTS